MLNIYVFKHNFSNFAKQKIVFRYFIRESADESGQVFQNY